MKKRKKSGHIVRTRGEQIGYAIIMLVLGLFAFSTIYPVWHVVMYSISDSKLSMSGGFFFWPRGFSLKSYKMVFQTAQIWIAYRNSILVTFVGTLMSVGLSAITAYPLSRKRLHGRNFLSMVVFFTMLFSGGMIPLYLQVARLGLLDSFWSMILPTCMSAYNMFILRNFMQGVPDSLEESARIDSVYDELVKGQSLAAEAQKLLMESTQDDLLSLLSAYAPEYEATGRTLGEKLYEGFVSAFGDISAWFDGLDAQFEQLVARAQEAAFGSTGAIKAAGEDRAQVGTAPVIQQTVNFNQPVESAADVTRRMQQVSEELAGMI